MYTIRTPITYVNRRLENDLDDNVIGLNENVIVLLLTESRSGYFVSCLKNEVDVYETRVFTYKSKTNRMLQTIK